jgi:hypothetical protein
VATERMTIAGRGGQLGDAGELRAAVFTGIHRIEVRFRHDVRRHNGTWFLASHARFHPRLEEPRAPLRDGSVGLRKTDRNGTSIRTSIPKFFSAVSTSPVILDFPPANTTPAAPLGVAKLSPSCSFNPTSMAARFLGGTLERILMVRPHPT